MKRPIGTSLYLFRIIRQGEKTVIFEFKICCLKKNTIYKQYQ